MNTKQFFGFLVFLSYFALFSFATAYVFSALDVHFMWTFLFVVTLGYFKYEILHWGTEGEYLP